MGSWLLLLGLASLLATGWAWWVIRLERRLAEGERYSQRERDRG